MANATHQHGGHSHFHYEADGHWGRLLLTLALVAGYAVAEVVGGLWSGSLALLADAGHMVSDLASLGISLFAMWLIRRQPTQQQTFGFFRAEILAALINGSLLFLVAGGILHEAWERWSSPQPILAGIMLWIALGGLVVNLLSMSLLHGGRHESLNLRGAWLHVVGDALGSVAVIVAAVLISQFGWNWADPVASVLTCLLILYSAWHLVSDAASILMEHAPQDIDVETVRRRMLDVPNVEGVHCLHVWTIASSLRAISAHVVLAAEGQQQPVLARLQELLRSEFGLNHITLQLEDSSAGVRCGHASEGACLLSRTCSGEHEHDHNA